MQGQYYKDLFVKSARIFILLDMNYLGNTNEAENESFSMGLLSVMLFVFWQQQFWQDHFNPFHMIKQAMVALECKARCPGADIVWSHSPHFFDC